MPSSASGGDLLEKKIISKQRTSGAETEYPNISLIKYTTTTKSSPEKPQSPERERFPNFWRKLTRSFGSNTTDSPHNSKLRTPTRARAPNTTGSASFERSNGVTPTHEHRDRTSSARKQQKLPTSNSAKSPGHVSSPQVGKTTTALLVPVNANRDQSPNTRSKLSRQRDSTGKEPLTTMGPSRDSGRIVKNTTPAVTKPPLIAVPLDQRVGHPQKKKARGSFLAQARSSVSRSARPWSFTAQETYNAAPLSDTPTGTRPVSENPPTTTTQIEKPTNQNTTSPTPASSKPDTVINVKSAVTKDQQDKSSSLNSGAKKSNTETPKDGGSKHTDDRINNDIAKKIPTSATTETAIPTDVVTSIPSQNDNNVPEFTQTSIFQNTSSEESNNTTERPVTVDTFKRMDIASLVSSSKLQREVSSGSDRKTTANNNTKHAAKNRERMNNTGRLSEESSARSSQIVRSLDFHSTTSENLKPAEFYNGISQSTQVGTPTTVIPGNDVLQADSAEGSEEIPLTQPLTQTPIEQTTNKNDLVPTQETNSQSPSIVAELQPEDPHSSTSTSNNSKRNFDESDLPNEPNPIRSKRRTETLSIPVGLVAESIPAEPAAVNIPKGSAKVNIRKGTATGSIPMESAAQALPKGPENATISKSPTPPNMQKRQEAISATAGPTIQHLTSSIEKLATSTGPASHALQHTTPVDQSNIEPAHGMISDKNLVPSVEYQGQQHGQSPESLRIQNVTPNVFTQKSVDGNIEYTHAVLSEGIAKQPDFVSANSMETKSAQNKAHIERQNDSVLKTEKNVLPGLGRNSLEPSVQPVVQTNHPNFVSSQPGQTSVTGSSENSGASKMHTSVIYVSGERRSNIKNVSSSDGEGPKDKMEIINISTSEAESEDEVDDGEMTEIEETYHGNIPTANDGPLTPLIPDLESSHHGSGIEYPDWRRKWLVDNRQLVNSASRILKNHQSCSKNTVAELIMPAIAPHTPFTSNTVVTVTNNICTAQNYESSDALFYQQLSTRNGDELTYLPLDTELTPEYRKEKRSLKAGDIPKGEMLPTLQEISNRAQQIAKEINELPKHFASKLSNNSEDVAIPSKPENEKKDFTGMPPLGVGKQDDVGENNNKNKNPATSNALGNCTKVSPDIKSNDQDVKNIEESIGQKKEPLHATGAEISGTSAPQTRGKHLSSREVWKQEWWLNLKGCNVYLGLRFSNEGATEAQKENDRITEKIHYVFKNIFGSETHSEINDSIDIAIFEEKEEEEKISNSVYKQLERLSLKPPEEKRIRLWDRSKTLKFIKNMGIDINTIKDEQPTKSENKTICNGTTPENAKTTVTPQPKEPENDKIAVTPQPKENENDIASPQDFETMNQLEQSPEPSANQDTKQENTKRNSSEYKPFLGTKEFEPAATEHSRSEPYVEKFARSAAPSADLTSTTRTTSLGLKSVSAIETDFDNSDQGKKKDQETEDERRGRTKHFLNSGYSENLEKAMEIISTLSGQLMKKELKIITLQALLESSQTDLSKREKDFEELKSRVITQELQHLYLTEKLKNNGRSSGHDKN
ncbi:chromatin-silencing protein SIR4 KNAG_0A04340 [Huiozyma naganishii CBS 8797]|uniref:Sir4 SID domain-containing protein n=1 Tax=Huiozyma naganishii (strain ATCC MYA-139 / BCRC 22969 / CBS 8797 / KCTC 17520 / NBRC 10181 / NCYC 3082 / Yp74L-3) TaxID=1071383 RepID=J7S2D5_HUIN7|nr:hypothetical protein KNAG_0A04340 [Kazachstania naganishii CBS 8797]CCK68109.1 hypothetical protein KNAG_0A04340 [Kazachstania naganishii CBS 8797]